MKNEISTKTRTGDEDAVDLGPGAVSVGVVPGPGKLEGEAEAVAETEAQLEEQKSHAEGSPPFTGMCHLLVLSTLLPFSTRPCKRLVRFPPLCWQPRVL